MSASSRTVPQRRIQPVICMGSARGTVATRPLASSKRAAGCLAWSHRPLGRPLDLCRSVCVGFSDLVCAQMLLPVAASGSKATIPMSRIGPRDAPATECLLRKPRFEGLRKDHRHESTKLAGCARPSCADSGVTPCRGWGTCATGKPPAAPKRASARAGTRRIASLRLPAQNHGHSLQRSSAPPTAWPGGRSAKGLHVLRKKNFKKERTTAKERTTGICLTWP